VGISLAALVALMRFKVGVIPVIVACGLAGLVMRLLVA
jgi:chromate transporter